MCVCVYIYIYMIQKNWEHTDLQHGDLTPDSNTWPPTSQQLRDPNRGR